MDLYDQAYKYYSGFTDKDLPHATDLANVYGTRVANIAFYDLPDVNKIAQNTLAIAEKYLGKISATSELKKHAKDYVNTASTAAAEVTRLANAALS